MILFALIIIGISAALTWPVGTNCMPQTPARACLSRLKQLGIGMVLYGSDHDERMPRRDEWMDAIWPYTKRAEYYHATELPEGVSGYGFAMNSKLDGKKLYEEPEPNRYPMLYDSINYSRNASDPFQSLPSKGRHKGKNHIAHLDSSVGIVLPADLAVRYPKFYKPSRGIAP